MKALEANYRLTLCLAIYILGIIGYTSFQHVMIFGGCDAVWHIATGELILELGHIPQTDTWSFTTGDSRWYNLSWLYDVVVGFIHRELGVKGIIAFNILLVSITPALVAALCFQRKCSPTATFLMACLALLLIKPSITIRPQQFTLTLLCLMLFALYHYREKHSRWIWAVPVISTVWANIHGSYLVIFTVLGSFFLEAFFQKDWQRAKTYMAVGFTSIAAMMINPLGYEIFYASWLTLGSEYSQDFVSEWRSGKLNDTPRVFVPIVIFIFLALYSRIKLPLADIILAVFWSILAVHSVRYGVISAVFVAPIFALMLTEILSRFKKANQIDATLKRDFDNPEYSKFLSILIVVLGIFYMLPYTHQYFINDEIHNPLAYPKKEIAYLKEHYPNTNILNEYCYGSYIIYDARDAGIKPFIDTRLDCVFPDDIKHDFFKGLFRPDWEEIMSKYDIDLAMFSNISDNPDPKIAFEKAGWPLIYKGPVANIYKNPNSNK